MAEERSPMPKTGGLSTEGLTHLERPTCSGSLTSSFPNLFSFKLS